MEEQNQTANPIQPELTATPAPTVPAEVPGKKSKATLYVILGLVVLLLAFVGVIMALNSSAEKTPAPTTTAQTTEINSTADLDKTSEELDNADLDSYETDLQLNDNDASTF